MLSFPCFRTDAYYPSGMSGGPILGEKDNRVFGVVSDSYQQELQTAYGAIYAAILPAEVQLPDKAGGSRVFSYQGLADEYLVDTDDVEVKVKRTDDESSLEWPDGAS
jgi:hypothetical protein